MEASGQVRAGWRSLQAEESSGKRVKVKTTKTLGAGVSDASWNRKGPGGGAEEQQGMVQSSHGPNTRSMHSSEIHVNIKKLLQMRPVEGREDNLGGLTA